MAEEQAGEQAEQPVLPQENALEQSPEELLEQYPEESKEQEDTNKDSDEQEEAKEADQPGEGDKETADDSSGDKDTTDEPPQPPAKEDTKQDDAPKAGNQEGEVKGDEVYFTIKGNVLVDGEVTEKEFKISSIDELPDSFEPKSYKDLLNISNAFTKFELEKESNSRQAESEKVEAEAEKAKKEYNDYLNSEIDYAIKQKRLPEVKAKEGDKDFLEDEGVKAQKEVWDFILAENDRLAAANSPYRITSFLQGLDQYEAKQIIEKQKEADKKEGEIRKARGSMVGSGVATSPDSKVYKSGEHGTLQDIVWEEMGED